MKTKLLKKIRKRFEIIYYPNEELPQYKVVDNDENDYYNVFYAYEMSRYFNTQNEAIAFIMHVVRNENSKFTRREKMKNIHLKVWHK